MAIMLSGKKDLVFLMESQDCALQNSKSKLEGPWEPSLFKGCLFLRPTRHDGCTWCVPLATVLACL